MINPNATWIDVNEFMPADVKKVIVRAINKENEAFYYGAYFSYPENRWYFIAYGDGTENLTVTHWMKEPIDTINQKIINEIGKQQSINRNEGLLGKVYI